MVAQGSREGLYEITGITLGIQGSGGGLWWHREGVGGGALWDHRDHTL